MTTYFQVNLDLKLLLCVEYNLKGMSFEMVRPYCLEAEEVGLTLSTISNLIVIKEKKHLEKLLKLTDVIDCSSPDAVFAA